MYYKQDFRDYSLYCKVVGMCKNGHHKVIIYATDRKKTYSATSSDMRIWTPCKEADIPLKAISKINQRS
jgi:hypothetical protein